LLQDLSGIDQKVFLKLSRAIEIVEIVKELVEIDLNEICDNLNISLVVVPNTEVISSHSLSIVILRFIQCFSKSPISVYDSKPLVIIISYLDYDIGHINKMTWKKVELPTS